MSARRPPELSEWLGWPTERIAGWVEGLPEPVVMGWPFNGTRRWYLAHRRQNPDSEDYLTTVIRRQGELHRMVLAHGVRAILAPGLGRANLARGPKYMKLALSGILRLASDEVYRRMFAEGVRLGFYGDYEPLLDVPEYRPALEACREIMANTVGGDGPIILIGLFADAPFETIARLSVEFAGFHGRPPKRQELIEAYYGVALPDLGFFVGFERPQLFDVPLVSTGQEDLYATLNPSPSVSERQFREILYDHLITRKAPDVDYGALPEDARSRLIGQVSRQGNATLGLGRLDSQTGMWQPVLPDDR